MKITRFIRLLVMVVFAIASLVPTPVYAKPPVPNNNSINPSLAATPKTASLTVNNNTGGVLYVSLAGPKSYYFNTAKKGNTTFSNIEPGKYTITVTSSACAGSQTFTKELKGKMSLNQVFYCKKV